MHFNTNDDLYKFADWNISWMTGGNKGGPIGNSSSGKFESMYSMVLKFNLFKKYKETQRPDILTRHQRI